MSVSQISSMLLARTFCHFWAMEYVHIQPLKIWIVWDGIRIVKNPRGFTDERVFCVPYNSKINVEAHNSVFNSYSVVLDGYIRPGNNALLEMPKCINNNRALLFLLCCG